MTEMLKNIDQAKLKGMKIWVFGFLVAGCGFLTALIGGKSVASIASALIYIGVIIGVVGLTIHFYFLLTGAKSEKESNQ